MDLDNDQYELEPKKPERRTLIDLEREKRAKEGGSSTKEEGFMSRVSATFGYLLGGSPGGDEEPKDEENEESGDADAESETPKDLTGVFVLVDGRSEFRQVTTGIASDTDIEVSGELEAGDEVITGPYNVLRGLEPGEKVKAEKSKGRRRGR